MRLEHSFQVAAPLERVWDALVDIERVAPCLPGAEIDEAGEDGSYRGSFTVKLGPTTAAYRGELAMEELDAAAHRSVMRASGTDKRGQGSAKATIVSTMREDGDVTTVEVETDFTITGRLARFGRGGMIQDVSNRLLRDFSDCLQKTIEAAEPAPEAAPAGASHPRRRLRRRRRPSRSAASRCSSARCWTACGEPCAAAAESGCCGHAPTPDVRQRRLHPLPVRPARRRGPRGRPDQWQAPPEPHGRGQEDQAQLARRYRDPRVAAHSGCPGPATPTRCDGFDSTQFLKTGGKAPDAEALDGLDSAAFLRSGRVQFAGANPEGPARLLASLPGLGVSVLTDGDGDSSFDLTFRRDTPGFPVLIVNSEAVPDARAAQRRDGNRERRGCGRGLVRAQARCGRPRRPGALRAQRLGAGDQLLRVHVRLGRCGLN